MHLCYRTLGLLPLLILVACSKATHLKPNAPGAVGVLGNVRTTTAPSADPYPKEVWFTPNIGSTDLLKLFTEPDSWAAARARITTFKFYAAQVALSEPAHCPACGPNLQPALVAADAFAKLASWHIDIALEVGAIKAEGTMCDPSVWAQAALQSIQAVKAHGGTVKSLAMDEPLFAALRTDVTPGCHLTLAEAAQRVATFMSTVRAAEPTLRIGDIEPYPILSPSSHQAFLAELARLDSLPDFFHLDIDWESINVNGGTWVADLRAMPAAIHSFGIPFGNIFDSGVATSTLEYYQLAMANTRAFASDVGRPDHVVVQSWAITNPGQSNQQQIYPENLGSPFSHTQFLSDALDAIGQLAVSPGVPRRLKPIYRFYDASAGRHYYSDLWWYPQSREGIAFWALDRALAGTVPIYSCQAGAVPFTSTTSDCEGQQVVRLLGYVLAAPGAHESTLYRCQGANDHLSTLHLEECAAPAYPNPLTQAWAPDLFY